MSLAAVMREQREQTATHGLPLLIASMRRLRVFGERSERV